MPKSGILDSGEESGGEAEGMKELPEEEEEELLPDLHMDQPPPSILPDDMDDVSVVVEVVPEREEVLLELAKMSIPTTPERQRLRSVITKTDALSLKREADRTSKSSPLGVSTPEKDDKGKRSRRQTEFLRDLGVEAKKAKAVEAADDKEMRRINAMAKASDEQISRFLREKRRETKPLRGAVQEYVQKDGLLDIGALLGGADGWEMMEMDRLESLGDGGIGPVKAEEAEEGDPLGAPFLSPRRLFLPSLQSSPPSLCFAPLKGEQQDKYTRSLILASLSPSALEKYARIAKNQVEYTLPWRIAHAWEYPSDLGEWLVQLILHSTNDDVVAWSMDGVAALMAKEHGKKRQTMVGSPIDMLEDLLTSLGALPGVWRRRGRTVSPIFMGDIPIRKAEEADEEELSFIHRTQRHLRFALQLVTRMAEAEIQRVLDGAVSGPETIEETIRGIVTMMLLRLDSLMDEVATEVARLVAVLFSIASRSGDRDARSIADILYNRVIQAMGGEVEGGPLSAALSAISEGWGVSLPLRREFALLSLRGVLGHDKAEGSDLYDRVEKWLGDERMRPGDGSDYVWLEGVVRLLDGALCEDVRREDLGVYERILSRLRRLDGSIHDPMGRYPNRQRVKECLQCVYIRMDLQVRRSRQAIRSQRTLDPEVKTVEETSVENILMARRLMDVQYPLPRAWP